MKQGRSLNELAAEITRQNERKVDFTATTDKLEVKVSESRALVLAAPGVGEYPLRNLAINQAASHVDIPHKYVQKLAVEQPELLATNLNTLLHAKPSRRLIRTLDGEGRAFLSDRYQRIDNIDVTKTTLEAFQGFKDLKVVSCEVTENNLYIKAVRSDIVLPVPGSRRVGDLVEAGVLVKNSEVGLGSVSVVPFANFLICTNGMVRDKAKRWNHVGSKIAGEEVGYLADDTIAAGDRFDLLRIRDALKDAFNQAGFQSWIDQLNDATKRNIPAANITKAIEVLANKLSFAKTEGDSILAHLIEGGDLSQYGLINAVTRTAQDAISYDRATELEAAGNVVLNLPANDWKQIAEAA